MLLPSPLLVPTPLTANRASLKPPLQISACGAEIVKDHSGLISFAEMHPKYIANKCCCPSPLRVSPSPSTFTHLTYPQTPRATQTPNPSLGVAGEPPPRSPGPGSVLSFPPWLFSCRLPLAAAFPRRSLLGCWQAVSTALPHTACTLHAGGGGKRLVPGPGLHAGRADTQGTACAGTEAWGGGGRGFWGEKPICG